MNIRTNLLGVLLGIALAMPGAAEVISISSTLCTSGIAVSGQGCMATSSYLTGSAVGGTIHTVDFNSGTAVDPNGVATYIGPLIDYSGAPNLDSSHFASAAFGVPMTINFNTGIIYFGLYWGSNDNALNQITFNQVTGGTTTQIATYFGNSAGTVSGDSYFSFNASGGSFNQVVLSVPAGSPIFETDNHAYVTAPTATPEPGTAWMMLFGLGVVALGVKSTR